MSAANDTTEEKAVMVEPEPEESEEPEEQEEPEEPEEEAEEEEEESGERRPKRARKQVEQYVPTEKKKEEKPLEVPKGKGSELGQIPNFERRLQSIKGTDKQLTKLHKICFPGQKGTKDVVKKNLRKFCGFATSQQKDTANVEFQKLEVALLKNISLLCDLELGGTKQVLVDRLADFLMKPEATGNEYRKSTKKPKAKKAAKKKTTKKKKKAKRDPRPLSGYMMYVKANIKTMQAKFPDLKMTEITPKLGKMWKALSDKEKESYKAKGVAEFNKTHKGASKKAPKKKASKKKEESEEEEEEEEQEEEEEEDDDSDSDEDVPLAKKMGFNDVMKKRIREIIEGADLNSLSIKKIRNQLKEEFGNNVVGENKEPIKAYIEEVVQSL